MRIAHVTLTPQVGLASALIDRFPLLRRLPEQQLALGHEVAIFARSDRRSGERRGGLALGTVAGPNRLVACLALAEELAAWRAEAVHLHGITVSTCLMASVLRARLPRTVVALQDQAFHFPARLAGRALVHLGLAAADVAFFAVRSQADPLDAAGALRAGQVVELPGGSTDFEPMRREAARRRTGLSGDPLYLWVGRLVEVKDPLTATKALARVLARNPKARLALVYGDDALHREVRAVLEPVARQVDDRGRVPYERLPALYSSADVFVLASRRESWCSALIEALACGASPVVSDVPANVAITGGLGHAFPVGDVDALEAALEAAPASRAAARQRFVDHLTFAELARQSVAAYVAAASAR